ncbi:MAG TPA: ferritin [Smithellaceae bacterium]|nr:ferritin [Smithellaceae bacterium]HQF85381.1 ferritin [Smithellaceae bacterium]HQG81595.1 ferritin [Smithellaceae bacterium]
MIGEKIQKVMNDQIKHELESFYIYLSMSAGFHEHNLNGMAHWMRCQAHEELVHAMKFYNHIIDRSGKVALFDLKQIQTHRESPLQMWRTTLEHEKFITGKINNILKISRQENDYASEPLLLWFLNEQIEEERSADEIVRQLTMLGDSPNGILMLDRQLASRSFSAGSPLDPNENNLVA